MNFTKAITESGDFEAMGLAQSFLEDRGFSVGRMQRDSPRGLIFGQFDISKWRNMDEIEIQALHGRMTGDMRNDPVTIVIFHTAPAEAIASASREEANVAHEHCTVRLA
ncbi:hypothetical protein [Collimonas pratensis]|uniref:hypothetical protein n=1 Tax=Collimonas pratensis TaxID=279113 RepID=UPI0007849BC2|nr:hypothetical protein [Collimonas pratensis]